jgi:hypothetical protein
VFQFVHGTFVFNITSIQRGGRFKQYEPAFFLSHWTMLDSTRHHDELSLIDPFVCGSLVLVAKFHSEAAFDYKEHLVLVVMMVEHEFAVQLDEFDLLAIQLGGDARLVVLGNLAKLLGDIDFGHGIPRGLIAASLMDGAPGLRVA